jgi:hypothetical protein
MAVPTKVSSSNGISKVFQFSLLMRSATLGTGGVGVIMVLWRQKYSKDREMCGERLRKTGFSINRKRHNMK